MRPCSYAALVLGLLFASLTSYSQSNTPAARGVDSLRRSAADSLPSTRPPPYYGNRKSELDTTVFYSARDSIVLSFESNAMTLHGGAKVKYGRMELEAPSIAVDNAESTISATGKTDSLGRAVGFPIFKDGSETYETRDIQYNFKSRRAQISDVVTRQGEGFLRGERVLKEEHNETYTLNNSYTTCDLAHPHFRIVSKKAKMIPGDKVVTGPFYMEINDVPMPLGFAFGAFPINKETSASGVIFPHYGEEGRRGFFLTGLGYFFDVSDYIKAKVTADIFTKGAYAARLNTVYRKRYAYNGSLNFSYTNNRRSYNVENNDRQADYNISWTHSTDSRRSSRFSASVNIASSSYTTNNLLQLNYDPTSTQLDNTSRKLSSNASYSQTFPGTPVSLGINLSHNQDLVTEKVDLTLPNITLNVNNIYPFKKISKNEFLEQLSIRYTFSGSQQLTNQIRRIDSAGVARDVIVPFDLPNIPLFFEKARRSIQHSIPISSSVKLFRYFVISPSFNYNENWYFERFEWGLNEQGNAAVVRDTIQEFGRVYNYSASVNLTTRIYGTFIFRKGSVKAIRHTLNPSVGYSYAPNFAQAPFDFFQKLRTAGGATLTQFRYASGAPSSQETSSLTFGVSSSVEMKVQGRQDSVARKVSLFNALSISSSYNFAADSFRLAPFSLSANTNVLQGKVNINFTATLDPYQYLRQMNTEQGSVGSFTERRVNRLAWEEGFSLGRITDMRLSLSTNLNPKGRQKDNDLRQRVARSQLSEREKLFLMINPIEYIDFDIPWNLRLNYSFSYTRPLSRDAQIVQSLRFSGDLSITKKWKIGFDSGYDIEKNEVTQTNITINRDLHCWQLSLNWVPFGKFQSYTFSVGVKAGILKDLKLDRKRSFFDNNY